MGEWGALEWVVALVLLGLVVGIVWFMTRGGAVQDRLSGRGQDHPEIDEGDGYLPDEEGSRYDAGGQDAAEVADEGDRADDDRAVAADRDRRRDRDRANRPGKDARRKSAASREKTTTEREATEHPATDLFDQESDGPTTATAAGTTAGAAAATAGAHALGEDEAADAGDDALVGTDATTAPEGDTSGPLGSVTDSDAEVEAGTVDEGDLSGSTGLREQDVLDTTAQDAEKGAETGAEQDDPSDIEAGTSSDPGELHSIEAEDPDDVAFPGYEEQGASSHEDEADPADDQGVLGHDAELDAAADEDETTEVQDHEHLSDFTGPGSDGSDRLPADSSGGRPFAVDEVDGDEADGDEDTSDTWDDVQPATGAGTVVEPGTVEPPEADFPADDEVPDVAPAPWSDDESDHDEPGGPAPDEDESGDQQAPGVTATSTQEWLGRGEIPADMNTDNLDPYSTWQQGR
ncbi:hypothetical protein I6I18_12105 [Kytococcus sedentarius]|uniref:Uncharacterized protein n=1 Tax=Kytococcus sedentarius (strain ATCC 14392 / DSM 20547 / JCM 11482 / CCUG 33030 / NBRC 15357 / NCTC 11040 / CCM 314 / 541) TaxID=478801 RepID=C7NJE1_KYTSD|nr:hypothetical protein [Kytococcus sedentarius]ACV05271.1 hypothetical protein Ksed_01830 [Kytococcus sedentarius DSM 20547]QQB63725.1 hypothetical protein I6I18_12105 [Kytococcus sedentarius]STX13323.1 Uncharacterised protein [Kytococcus sedentarius]